KDSMIQELLNGKNYDGNVIPWLVTLYLRNAQFPRSKGMRIVRIAVQPDLTRHGLGSIALKKLENAAKNNGLDWIGTGFGATRPLFNFWKKNGFIPFHLSPRITPSTGERSIFMIKPLSETGRTLCLTLFQDFKLRFFDLIRHVFYDTDPMLISEIIESLSPFRSSTQIRQELTHAQRARLDAFLSRQLDDTAAMDAILTLIRNYYLQNTVQVSLSPMQKTLLVMRILQARTWQQVLQQLKLKIETAQGMLRKALKKISSNLPHKMAKPS
ncbi:MAG: GNAT family N-acetyltransferase, partial [Candidatus Helarchaeales archaeon]